MVIREAVVPKDVWDRMVAFLEAGKSGSIVLDVKEGQVLAWKITEAGRTRIYDIDREKTNPLR